MITIHKVGKETYKYEHKPLLEEMPYTLIKSKVWILYKKTVNGWEYEGNYTTKRELLDFIYGLRQS